MYSVRLSVHEDVTPRGVNPPLQLILPLNQKSSYKLVRALTAYQEVEPGPALLARFAWTRLDGVGNSSAFQR
jgi:hypothetical protein